jgi:hypothetical protein
MAKLRVLFLETEGVDPSAIADAISAWVDGTAPYVESSPSPAPALPAALATPPAGEAPRVEQNASPAPAVERPKRGAGKVKRPAAAPPPAPAATEGDSGCVAACVKALARGPLTSMEIIKSVPYSEGGVYMALKALRTQGRIEMVPNESGPGMKNRLVA